jgi:hypothetical protein
MHGLSGFAVGVGAALLAAAAGPALGRRLRPAARGMLKQLVILGEGARVRAAQVQEDLADLAAEARADAQAARQAAPGAGTAPNGPNGQARQ